DFPFLFKSKEQAYSVLDGEIGQYVMGLLDKIGIKGLAWYENGFRHFTNSRRPVNTPEDVKGLKLRTMENKIHMALWRAMGADPTPMAWGEVFTALQQGTVDGQENPIPIIYVQKINEVQKHLAITGHVFSPSMIAIAKAKFDAMPKEHQAIIMKASRESALYQREQITRMENEQVEKLKELGMLVTTPDVAAFREATKSVYDEFRGELGEDAKLLDQILSGLVSERRQRLTPKPSKGWLGRTRPVGDPFDDLDRVTQPRLGLTRSQPAALGDRIARQPGCQAQLGLGDVSAIREAIGLDHPIVGDHVGEQLGGNGHDSAS
ncbi:MAG: DctP family TRAP transporter solute-binding subunit, partial [Clostridia bacterium]|nr:DctP family TRAP transporter solute-binding subunit [Clostridia bacterium]